MHNTSSAAELETMAFEALAVNWVAAASMAVVLYDHFITIDQECTRMWPGRITIPKLLFFLNRYVVQGLLIFNSIASSQTHLTEHFCVFYLRWLAVTLTITNAVVEGILLARVWALYQTNILVLGVAVFCYLGGVITLIGLTTKDYVGEGVSVVNDFNVLPGCYAASVPPIIAGYWIAPVVIESVFFVLIVSRSIRWKRKSANPLLVLLARDSTIYFAVIFVLLLANLFVFEYGPPFLCSMMVTPSNAAGCIAGNRMLLNLRGHRTHTEIEMSGYLSFGPDLPRLMDDRSVLTITNFGVSTTRTNGGRLSTTSSSILSADRGRESVTVVHGQAI